MTVNELPTLEEYWMGLAECLPEFSSEEQRVAIVLCRELAKGKPLSLEGLARALHATPAECRQLIESDPLKPFVHIRDDGRIVGFFGLSVVPMHHKLLIGGRTLWSWCAFDSVFIPELLGETARIESPDPETGKVIRLTITPNGIEAFEPESAVVSLLRPNFSECTSAENVIGKFCHFVFFFVSRKSGERWMRKHPGTFLYPLDEVQRLARRHNARNFGLELKRRNV